MKKYPWFKFYIEAFKDPKFVVVASENDIEEMTAFGIWTALLCIAAKSPIRGTLAASDKRNFTMEEIDQIIDFQEARIDKIIESFITLDMMDVDEEGGLYIKNFKERQSLPEITPHALYMQEWREKQKKKEKEEIHSDVHSDITVKSQVMSHSSSSSTSLIKDSLTNGENQFSNNGWSKSQKLYTMITSQPLVPTAHPEAYEELAAILDRYKDDINQAAAEGKVIFAEWCNTKSKSGKTYARTNTAWLGKWIEQLSPQPENASKVERPMTEKERQEYEEWNRKMNEAIVKKE